MDEPIAIRCAWASHALPGIAGSDRINPMPDEGPGRMSVAFFEFSTNGDGCWAVVELQHLQDVTSRLIGQVRPPPSRDSVATAARCGQNASNSPGRETCLILALRVLSGSSGVPHRLRSS